MSAMLLSTEQDPSLPSVRCLLAATDVFIDNFLGLAHLSSKSRRISQILMHAIDKILRPLDASNSPFRRQVILLKELIKEDYFWHTSKIILGWVLDMIYMTVSLPQH